MARGLRLCRFCLLLSVSQILNLQFEARPPLRLWIPRDDRGIALKPDPTAQTLERKSAIGHQL
jgi:hypothetical protein